MFYIILTTTNYLYCTRTELTAVKYNSHAQQQKQTDRQLQIQDDVEQTSVVNQLYQ